MGGLRYVVGDPSTPPSPHGHQHRRLELAATFACVGALSALHYREKTGRGQVVDSAIYEAVLNMMESLITEYDKTGYVRERTGAILPNVAPSNVYPTRDGLVLIAANQDTVFGRLCEAMGKPELAKDARYAATRPAAPCSACWTISSSDWTRRCRPAGARAVDGRVRRAGRPDLPRAGHAGGRRTSRPARPSSPRIIPTSASCGCRTSRPSSPRRRAHPQRAPPRWAQHNDEVYPDLLGWLRRAFEQLKQRKVI
jgi:formyl-CoA transferase